MSRADRETIETMSFAGRFVEACGTSEPAQIQRLLNISYQAAKNYLDGRLPDARVLIVVAECTPYSIHWLLTGRGDKFSTPAANGDTPLLARQISELIRQEVQKAVSAIAEERTDSQSRVVVLRNDQLRSEKPKEAKVPLIKST
jgi:hypothetical protein